MRRLPLITVVCTASAALAACSTATASAPAAVALSAGTHQTCASTVQAWLRGPGGSDLRAAITAGTAMGTALESGSRTRVTGAAAGLSSAADRAVGHVPPACADRGAAYQIAMRDWMTGASDAKDGNLTGTSSKIATGANLMDAVATLKRLSPTLLADLSRPVAIPVASAPPAPAPAPPASPAPTPATTAAQPTAPTPAPTQASPTASAAPAGCYPLSDEGTCYEPGEYCRDDDHGMSGVAGDGQAITCEDNDGWRWEPS